jgi:hypothetical protein
MAVTKATFEMTEKQVRKLRDLVYDQPTADKNWEGCKLEWMKPEEINWLQKQVNKQTKP